MQHKNTYGVICPADQVKKRSGFKTPLDDTHFFPHLGKGRNGRIEFSHSEGG
jgi:hypothetical protein